MDVEGMIRFLDHDSAHSEVADKARMDIAELFGFSRDEDGFGNYLAALGNGDRDKMLQLVKKEK